MGYQPWTCAVQTISTSGTVGTSGSPILIYGVSFLSGTTAANPVLFNGTSSAGTNPIGFGPGTLSVWETVPLSVPVSFPAGCYVSFDANTTTVSVMYQINT